MCGEFQSEKISCIEQSDGSSQNEDKEPQRPKRDQKFEEVVESLDLRQVKVLIVRFVNSPIIWLLSIGLQQGSIRAPHWRGGGRVFPPRPRSYEFSLPRNVRRLGLAVALSTKYAQVLVSPLSPSLSPSQSNMESLEL